MALDYTKTAFPRPNHGSRVTAEFNCTSCFDLFSFFLDEDTQIVSHLPRHQKTKLVHLHFDPLSSASLATSQSPCLGKPPAATMCWKTTRKVQHSQLKQFKKNKHIQLKIYIQAVQFSRVSYRKWILCRLGCNWSYATVSRIYSGLEKEKNMHEICILCTKKKSELKQNCA